MNFFFKKSKQHKSILSTKLIELLLTLDAKF